MSKLSKICTTIFVNFFCQNSNIEGSGESTGCPIISVTKFISTQQKRLIMSGTNREGFGKNTQLFYGGIIFEMITESL